MVGVSRELKKLVIFSGRHKLMTLAVIQDLRDRNPCHPNIQNK